MGPNINPGTGAADKAHRGNILVISTVAQPEQYGSQKQSCPIGYVDARANKNANQLAQDIADQFAQQFKCGIDQAKFYGNIGKYSGAPSRLQ